MFKIDFHDRNEFNYFYLKSLHWYFLPSFQLVCLSVQKKVKIDFKDSGQSDQLGFFFFFFFFFLLFSIYKSPRYFTLSFESIGLSVQNKYKIDFSRWQPWWPSWIKDQNDFESICSTIWEEMLKCEKLTDGQIAGQTGGRRTKRDGTS